MKLALSSAKLLTELEAAFPGCTSAPAQSFVEANPDLAMLDADANLHELVPAYMAWCVRNRHRRDTLIPDHTVGALAEFGRSKNPTIGHLNFKFTCSPAQRAVVVEFLRWCLDPERILNAEQIERSLRHWAQDPVTETRR